MEKIDITKIRGHWEREEVWNDTYRKVAGGDDTVPSLNILAQKVNEIVDWINKHSPVTETKDFFHPDSNLN